VTSSCLHPLLIPRACNSVRHMFSTVNNIDMFDNESGVTLCVLFPELVFITNSILYTRFSQVCASFV
jgi:hypothetical protein